MIAPETVLESCSKVRRLISAIRSHVYRLRKQEAISKSQVITRYTAKYPDIGEETVRLAVDEVFKRWR